MEQELKDNQIRTDKTVKVEVYDNLKQVSIAIT